MLKGFSTPLSPFGRANLTPAPPWHYAGDLLTIEFHAAPEAVRAVLPPGVEPGADAGRCLAFFADWQACTDGAEELLDPVRAQYREFFVLVSARCQGRAAMTCPYILVDQDISLMRGLIQGFPKALGSIYVTRSFGVEGVAAAPLAPGSVLAGTVAARERRIVEARVKLDRVAEKGAAMDPIVNLRYFPQFKAGEERPAVAELVWSNWENKSVSPVWTGGAELRFFESPCHELDALAPVSVGAGYRYSMAITIRPGEDPVDVRGEWK
jgi:hypothetical protein